MNDRDIEDTREPPDGIYHAVCAICGEVRDLGDMKEVEDETYVCNLRGMDCLKEWQDRNPEEEEG